VQRPSVFVPRRLSALDAALLDLERPHTPTHLGAIAIADGRISPERIARRIESRLWRLGNLGRTLSSVPFSLARPGFEDAPRFDPRDHIHGWALPGPGGEAELLDASTRIFAATLDRSRPLFEIHVFEGLDGERGAVVCKVHHAVARTAGGGTLLEALLDSRPEGPDELAPPERRGRPRRAITRLAGALAEGAARGLGDAGRALSLATRPRAGGAALRQLRSTTEALLALATDPAPVLPWNAPLGWRRRLALTSLPLASAERIAAEHDCSVSEVVLCAIGGALHRHVQSNGLPPLRADARVLASVCPRDAGPTLSERRASALLVPIPVDIGDEALRLCAVRRAVHDLEARGARADGAALFAIADRLPPALAHAVARRLHAERIANLAGAIVEGPAEPRFLCGRRLLSVHPFVPLVDGVGLGFATYTYAGTLFAGLSADSDLVPDLDKLRLSLEQSFAALMRI
jgi:diacylglycerol O-acyltransferase